MPTLAVVDAGKDNQHIGGAGLRGQSAGSTALCTVGKTGTGLTYRGYDITSVWFQRKALWLRIFLV